MKKIIGCIGLIFFFAASGHPSDSGKWCSEGEKNGIRLFSQSVKGSPYVMVRGETILNADLTQIASVLRDLSTFTTWMPDLISARRVKVIDLQTEIEYHVIDFPWPFLDRDVILKSTGSIDPDTGIIRIDTIALKEPMVSLDKNLVRITDLSNTFVLEYVDKDKTRVEYTLHLDTRGNLPSFAVNMEVVKNPYKVLMGLKRILQSQKYKGGDVFSEENIYFARVILNAQLRKYLKDKRFVDRLTNDDTFLLTAYKAGVSEEGLKTVISAIFAFLTRQHTHDQSLIDRISTDKELIQKAYDNINSSTNLELMTTIFLRKNLSEPSFLNLFLDDKALVSRVVQDSDLLDMISKDKSLHEFVIHDQANHLSMKSLLKSLMNTYAS
ncbi:MAG: hypothetical protein KJ737_11500 [Proteobacteria bacterium]|nr:hypothetical protein [Pseudomonadota bacterium]